MVYSSVLLLVIVLTSSRVNGYNFWSSEHEGSESENADTCQSEACSHVAESSKQTFPDLSYGLFGYNILRGYPLDFGHDEGFTFPIFAAQYTEQRQSADLRFVIPKGLHMVPDVSCVTSFSSHVAKSVSEFDDHLSVSASVEGGGWGVHFSASTGYKKATKDISASHYTYITSSAVCTNYFSKIDPVSPPPFDSSFLHWAEVLASSDDPGVYIEFFEIYGTHFLNDVEMGARFTYQYRLEESKVDKISTKEYSLSAQASYSGLFSLSGSFGMDSSQTKAVSDFLQNVETTTITIGAAPPADGDALAWAASVKDNPVPVKYTLKSIEDLFTKKYMNNINIDYGKINANIKKYKMNYCEQFKNKGEVQSCVNYMGSVLQLEINVIMQAKPDEDYRRLIRNDGQCLEGCNDIEECIAFTTTKEYCYLFFKSKNAGQYFLPGEAQENTALSIVLTKLMLDDQNLILLFTVIDGNRQVVYANIDYNTCLDKCRKYSACLAVTYLPASYDGKQNYLTCFLYSKEGVNKLETIKVPTSYPDIEKCPQTVFLGKTNQANEGY